MANLTEQQKTRMKQLANIILEDDRLLEKKKNKKKKDCVKGNKNHDSEGKFTKSGSGSSWSGHSDGKDTSTCKAGQWRLSGKRKLITKGKGRCGRDDRLDPNIKGKYKCKDGTLSEIQTDDVKQLADQVSTNLQQFSDSFQSHSEFMSFFANMKDFMELMSNYQPVGSARDSDSVNNHADNSKQRGFPFSNGSELEHDEELTGDMTERRRKKNRMKKGMKGEGLTREMAQKECGRFGLFSFEHFLQILNRYETAKKASLNRQQK